VLQEPNAVQKRRDRRKKRVHVEEKRRARGRRGNPGETRNDDENVHGEAITMIGHVEMSLMVKRCRKCDAT